MLNVVLLAVLGDWLGFLNPPEAYAEFPREVHFVTRYACREFDVELYEQANARLHRQGQTRPVIIYHLTCRGTMDETVLAALRSKGDTQQALLQHITRLREQMIY